MSNSGTWRLRRRVEEGVFALGSLSAAVLFLVPLVLVVSASLRQPGLPPPRTLEWVPSPVAWGNYPAVFQLLPLGAYAANSLLIAGLAIPLTLVTASWAGLGMLQVPPRWRTFLIWLSVLLLLLPTSSLWLARFLLFRHLGLINTFGAVLAPALMGSSPLFVLLFFWSFRRVPPELFEAARLDGGSLITLWDRVALPLSRPTVTAVAVLTFLLYWSDFLHPLLYLKSQHLYTLPVGLQQLQQLDRSNWPLLLAASVLLAGPAALVFLGAQRYFLQEGRLEGSAGF
ncbi:MAG: carbohydrate ABC transporter permease [Armatimonadetes bacterium]|nr:carbohydrate ABC transporter permease [Armatimonadota bacterium]